jgi:hypothetical protein
MAARFTIRVTTTAIFTLTAFFRLALISSQIAGIRLIKSTPRPISGRNRSGTGSYTTGGRSTRGGGNGDVFIAIVKYIAMRIPNIDVSMKRSIVFPHHSGER